MANDVYKNDEMIDGEIEMFDMGDTEPDVTFDLPSEGTEAGAAEDPMAQARNALLEKYEATRAACQEMIERVNADMKETNYNPYFRTTTTRRIEILRKSTDTEPVDVFEFENTTGFSLRAIAISAAVLLAADIAAAVVIKKKFF